MATPHRHLAIADGVVAVREPADPPADPIGVAVLEQVRRGRHDVARWVELLAGVATTLDGDHLVSDGVMARRLGRLARSSSRHVAVDAVAAAAPRVLLRHAAASYRPADRRMVALAALAVATGLDSVIADGANRSIRDRLEELASEADGDLRDIVIGVDTAAARITLSTKRGH